MKADFRIRRVFWCEDHASFCIRSFLQSGGLCSTGHALKRYQPRRLGFTLPVVIPCYLLWIDDSLNSCEISDVLIYQSTTLVPL